MKKIIILLLAITLIFSLAACKKNKNKNKNNDQTPACSGHVDADDNYKCDNCGEDFDDGDEVHEAPIVYRDVTFLFKLEDGTPVSGISFTIERGDNSFTLVTGANGKVTKNLATGLYSLSCDYETLPEYCTVDTYGFKVAEDTSEVVVLVTNNTPDGSANKPFPTTDEPTEYTLEANQEIFFTYRGTSVQYATIHSDSAVLNYKGESYSAIDGVISVALSPEEIGELTVFSIKNTTNSGISVTLEMISPLGSLDNPIALEGSSISELFSDGKILYYKWTAPKDGVLIATTAMANADVTVRRNITKIIDDQEIIVPIVAQSDDGSAIYMSVKEGDEIVIGLTAVSPTISTVIELTLEHFEGSETDPTPLFSSSVTISLDAGESIVFSAVGSNKVSVENCSNITANCGGNSYTSEDGSLSFDLADWSFELTNNSEDRNSIVITIS